MIYFCIFQVEKQEDRKRIEKKGTHSITPEEGRIQSLCMVLVTEANLAEKWQLIDIKKKEILHLTAKNNDIKMDINKLLDKGSCTDYAKIGGNEDGLCEKVMLKYEVSKKIEMREKGNKQVAELKKEVKLMDEQVKLLSINTPNTPNGFKSFN